MTLVDPYQTWLAADTRFGPQRAYRLARKLPQQLRPQGGMAAARAEWALALTLFWMGRFGAARALLAALPSADGAPDIDARLGLAPAQLAWTLAIHGEERGALAAAARALAWAQKHADAGALAQTYQHLGQLHCILDAPETCLAYSRQALAAADQAGASGRVDEAGLLEYWALSRLGRSAAEAGAQSTLADLRRREPAREARAFSLYAQALFHQSPAYALTQLDAALDLNARFGLHHWEARLLHLKSQSLDATGQLTEASRFHRLAQETAQRQGARLFLDNIAGIESRTHASPYREPGQTSS